MRFKLLVSGLVAAAAIALSGTGAEAQTLMRTGLMRNVLVDALANRSTVFSSGVLADLETDENFGGDYQQIFDYASGILNDYTVVDRGGVFPENAGIPRDRQLPRADVVYTVFSLDNGNELFLYRSPLEDTARYFIRESVPFGG